MTPRVVTEADMNHAMAGAAVAKASVPPLLRSGPGLFGLVAAGLLLALRQLQGASAWVGVAALLVCLVATLVLLLRRRAWTRDALRASPLRQGDYHIHWDAEAIRSSSAGQQTLWRWSHIDRVIRANGALVLVSGQLDYMLVPGAAFASPADLDAVEAEFTGLIDKARTNT